MDLTGVALFGFGPGTALPEGANGRIKTTSSVLLIPGSHEEVASLRQQPRRLAKISRYSNNMWRHNVEGGFNHGKGLGLCFPTLWNRKRRGLGTYRRG